jgi:hypothetical protein
MTQTSHPLARAVRPAVVSLALLGLGACATELPAGPSLMAMPRPGEDYGAFRQHDDYCRATAVRTAQTTPGDAAANHAVGGAAIGAGVGAAAGALIGSASGAAGPGAAVGAASGLLFGGALGANSGDAAAARIQHRYNVVYAQCMTAYGERIAQPRPYYAYPRPYLVPAYPPPPPPYPY